MTTTVSGSTHACRPGATKPIPSTADRTLMAGVIIPSPYRRAAPKSPSRIRTFLDPTSSSRRGATRAVSARMPPSPSLSARNTKRRYLTDTTITSAQKISDRTPSTLVGSTASPYPRRKLSRRA